MEPNEIEVYRSSTELLVERSPNEVLTEAHKAAAALKDVLSNKKNPVKFGGEQYLEFEDWQTIGKFYGVTAKVISTKYIELAGTKGFEATAVAFHVPTGKEVSAADAMCLDDERNWKGKPLFQLRSMAQTRACSKVLRNVLAWVVVLGGYKPTPAEEMDGVHHDTPVKLKPTEEYGPSHDNKTQWAEFKRVREELGVSEDDAKRFLDERLPQGQRMSEVTPPRVALLTSELKKKFGAVEA